MIKNKVFIFFFILIIGFLFNSCATRNEAAREEVKPVNLLDNIVGVWDGSYTGANQGETGLTLDIYKEKEKYVAIFHYYNLPGRNNVTEGKYYMDVTYNKETGKYFLKASEWIIHPRNYSSGDLEGSITGNFFTGSLIVSNYASGIEFSVVRQR